MIIQLITVSLLFLGTQVLTQACFHGDVQLVNGDNINKIVEFCYKGEWRRICVSDTWSNVEANIVCSQLGYNDQGATTSDVSISENSPYMFLRFVNCDDSDGNIDECYYEARAGCNKINKHARVQCLSANCTDSDIRFVGGATDNEGKVEICNDSRWMAICSNGWTDQDAGQMYQKFGFASIGAEVLVFNPRRVPTINCTISDSGNLSCNESCDDGTTDLGIRCVRQEVLNQKISVESSCGAELSTTALGVLVGLLVALLVVLLIVCGAMWNRVSQKHKQICISSETSTLSTIQRQLNNPVYDTSMEPHNAYSSSGPTYEQVANGNEQDHTYSILECNQNTNRRSNQLNPIDEKQNYHVVESGRCEGVEGAGCDGVYSEASNYEVPMSSKTDSKVWLCEEEYTIQ
ncbi:scavenger receptor cysteine-rich type 1 protein M160-like isoform X1 [Halichondria panicea]|uniref:scavenger receptor cysteine-rich type 1 protein M160-like isoform X1 n=1 Tax=Halichondria panicea TaxID=6063 RepID=UPI00312BBB1F